MVFTKKQITVLYVWMTLGAIISLLPPRTFVYGPPGNSMLNVGNKMAEDIVRPTLLFGTKEYYRSSGDMLFKYSSKGVNIAVLMAELSVITFFAGICFLAARKGENL